jgi:uncharacterized protein YjiS (DUF1127 family)
MTSESRVLRSFWAGASRAAAWPFRVAAARANLRALGRMDRRELADIGLNPSDVRDATALPLDRDPTALLAARVRERRANALTAPSTAWDGNGREEDPQGDPDATVPRPARAPACRAPPPSEQAELRAGLTRLGARLAEQVDAQRARHLAIAEPPRGHLEPAPDHPGVGA